MIKKGVCVFLDGLFKKWYRVLFCFFLFFCTPKLRTSGGTLTLFIFIDFVSVCGKKNKKHHFRPDTYTYTPTQNTQTHTAIVMPEFSSGAEQGEASPNLLPVHLSLSPFLAYLWCAPENVIRRQGKRFSSTPPTPPFIPQTHISTHLAYEQDNLLSLTHSHHYLEPPSNTTPLLPSQSKTENIPVSTAIW